MSLSGGAAGESRNGQLGSLLSRSLLAVLVRDIPPQEISYKTSEAAAFFHGLDSSLAMEALIQEDGCSLARRVDTPALHTYAVTT